MFDTDVPAVVFKLDPNVMHHGGLGVIRSLGRKGVQVYGVHEDSLAPAAHSRYLAAKWMWSPAEAEPEIIYEGLLRLSAHIDRPAVLLPTDDAAAIFLAEHGEQLRDRYWFPRIDADLPRAVSDKYSLYQLCRSVGFPCPDSMLVSGWDEARQFADQHGYPVVGKLTSPWKSVGSSPLRSTTIVRCEDDLCALYSACAEIDGCQLMLQEHIPGGSGKDWFFHGYCDAASTCEPAFTGVKERSYPARAGLTCLGRCEENDELLQQVTGLLKSMSFHGIVDLDLRFDDRSGTYKLLDFNPRLGAQFRLFRTTADVDVATAYYLDATGQDIPPGRQLVGRRFVAENYDPIAALSYFRSGDLRLRDWFKSVRNINETAWYARDDLLPFLLMCGWMGWRLLSRPFVGNRRRPVIEKPYFVPGRNYL